MKITKLTAILALALPMSAMAGWQFAPMKTVSATAPVKSGKQVQGFKAVKNPALKFVEPWKDSANMPAQFGSLQKDFTPYHIQIFPGTLKGNLTRIMQHSKYKMIWKSQYDYPVIGKAVVKGKTFYKALNTLLSNYPVKAVFYKQNEIMTIVPRKTS